MKELLSIGDEIEKLFQMYSIPQETLQKLISRRQELLDSLEEVSIDEAKALECQDSRILERCQQAKESLERQMKAVKGRNEKSRLSGKSSRYFDSHC